MIELLVVFSPLVWLMVSAFFYAGGEYFSKLWAINPTVSISLQVVMFCSMAALTWLPAQGIKIKLQLWVRLGYCWLLWQG